MSLDGSFDRVAAWSFADAPNPVGRRLSGAEADAVTKSGVAAMRQVLYGTSQR